MIEMPHCNHVESKVRELFVLRYDSNGQWSEHTFSPETTLDESFDQENDVIEGPSTKIFTTDFPQCFLIASRIKQDNFWIGPEGGVAHSSVEPSVKAMFVPNAVSRKVRVGMQILHVNSSSNLPMSPIVTIEPRRKKVKKPITVTIPFPEIPLKKNFNDIRLISSITGGTSKAQWQDVTDLTKLEFKDGLVHFKTSVTGRFCLMITENRSDAVHNVTKFYNEALKI